MISSLSTTATPAAFSQVKSVRRVEEKAVQALTKAQDKAETQAIRHGESSKQATKAADRLDRTEAKVAAQLTRAGSSLLAQPSVVNEIAAPPPTVVPPSAAAAQQPLAVTLTQGPPSQEAHRGNPLGSVIGISSPGEAERDRAAPPTWGLRLRTETERTGAEERPNKAELDWGRGLALGRQALELRERWMNPSRSRRAIQNQSLFAYSQREAREQAFAPAAAGDAGAASSFKRTTTPVTLRSADIALSVLSHWANMRPSLLNAPDRGFSASRDTGVGAYRRAQSWDEGARSPWSQRFV